MKNIPDLSNVDLTHAKDIVCEECGSLQEDDQLIEFITCVNCKATISL